ncbi:hypothetical protein P153DRAFT_297675 [Dothidotthia symphoricarpi CBS 119687]|uniref:2EXR domain-containing protein n=1 Tax=Dothidotthia symphoricarpi CBS 119687 TaxID=1392245 RepID=A0A6A6A601_9PLEO|nr:uncharacterized protein P153DRAFT_297675 [Dothidotthia symphoricarpi CBS 119687]KAF2126583.1 hypothetical protein P153DRAFT_297675 [Dothidotthia symphoricarpi CBS 119687]
MDKQEDSIFFRLPAELRNQVYEALLCPNTLQSKDLTHDTKVPTSGQEPLYPAILSTCRRVHEEATDLLYTSHFFHAHPSLLTSLPHLTPSGSPVLCKSGIEKIQRWQLTLRLDTDPRFTMQQATSAFSNAEYVEIRVWQSTFDACDSSVLKLFLGVHGVRIARVCGSVEPELARWLEERMMQPLEKEERDLCHCVDETREIRCGRCYKRIDGCGSFEERDAWRFGNR